MSAIGLVARQGHTYRNAPASERYLVRGAPAYFGDYYRFHIDRQLSFPLLLNEGQNIVIDYRFSEDKNDRLPALAAELVALKVQVIVASGSPASFAARDATRAIPIVMGGIAADPVATGLVTSLARPGGNITGMTMGVLRAGVEYYRRHEGSAPLTPRQRPGTPLPTDVIAAEPRSGGPSTGSTQGTR